MARMRWFIAGAVAAAGALAAAGQVRRMLGTGDMDELEPWDEPQAYEPSPYEPPATTPRPAAAFASYDAPSEDDTQELRLRIDETRERIRQRTQDAAESDAEPDDA